MKNILLLNQGNTNNIGDIAINLTIKNFYEIKGYKVDTYPFYKEHKIILKLKKNKIFEKIIRHNEFILDFLNFIFIKNNIKIEKYDAIIIGGGELLAGHPGFNSSLYIFSKLAKKYDKRIYLLGVSGDKNMKNSLLKRNFKSLKKVDKVLVRDENTKNICKEIYLKDTECYPDVVFAYHKVNNKINNYEKYKKGIVIVPIYFNYLLSKNLMIDDNCRYIQYMINYVMKERIDNEKIIITNTTIEDQEICEKLFLELSKKITEVEYIKCDTIEKYEEIVRKARLVISARMHALILAKINNCSVKVIPFKEKLKGFENKYILNKNDNNDLEKEALKSMEDIYMEIEKNEGIY